jgi:hypothetical protein
MSSTPDIKVKLLWMGRVRPTRRHVRLYLLEQHGVIPVVADHGRAIGLVGDRLA